MFEFIAEKLWFWLILALIFVAVRDYFYSRRTDGWFGKTLYRIPFAGTVLSSVLFMIALLCRAWG